MTTPSPLELLQQTAHHPDRSVLLTGAAVVTMDPAIGELPVGDVLLRGTSIAEVSPDLSRYATTADVVIDARGCIIAPGLVDTHRHAWQAQMRRTIPDVDDLMGYVTSTLIDVAPLYTPHDMYVGTRLAALTALDSGVTTMLDFSHNSRTPAHSDAAIQALADTGIRGIHASMAPHFGDWDQQWPDDLNRLRNTWFRSDDQLLTLRLAALAVPDFGTHIEFGPDLARIADRLDIGVSLDMMMGQAASAKILEWERGGLLNPRLTSIHSTALSAEAWRALAAHGATVALAPTSDMQIGLEDAIPPVDAALAAGIRPGLSIDVEVALASDMFTQMRTLHAFQRSHAVSAVYGTDETPARISTRDVLDFATQQGAHTNGLGTVTGSLTPGKQADLIVVAAQDVNNMPLNDPIGTLVLATERSNIVSVWVAGQVRKWDRQLLDVNLTTLQEQVTSSRDDILGRVANRRRSTSLT